MRKLVGTILVFSSMFGGALAACSNNDGTSGDSGPDAIVKKEAGLLDNSAPDTSVTITTPAGKQLAASDSIQVFGITSDGLVIYADNATGASLFAADVTGTNAPIKIASPTVSSKATYIAGIAGKVVFVWEGVSTTANAAQVGALNLWTQATGYQAATPKSLASAGFGATTDGQKVLFSANSNAQGTQGDIVGGKVDGTAQSTLVTGAALGTTCAPQMGFAGGTTAVVATCASAPPDGGTPVATVSSFDASWVKTDIITNALNFWGSDTAGDKLLVATTAGLQTFATGGGSALAIDSKNIASPGFGYMTRDGAHAIYATAAGDLWESPTVSPVPLELIATGVKVVRSISTDDKYLIYHTNEDTTKFASDLYMTSTTTADAPTTLVATTTGALFGLVSTDDFTTDSKFVLFISNADTSHFVGDLNYAPVTGGAPKTLGTSEWLNLSATASKIVYNDNCQLCGTNANNQVIGVADIKAVDLSVNTPTPTMLQAAADPQIYMAPAKDRVVYTFSTNPQGPDGGAYPLGNGLYSIAVP